MSSENDLHRLADMLQKRNEIDTEIPRIIDRPTRCSLHASGHLSQGDLIKVIDQI